MPKSKPLRAKMDPKTESCQGRAVFLSVFAVKNRVKSLFFSVFIAFFDLLESINIGCHSHCFAVICG